MHVLVRFRVYSTQPISHAVYKHRHTVVHARDYTQDAHLTSGAYVKCTHVNNSPLNARVCARDISSSGKASFIRCCRQHRAVRPPPGTQEAQAAPYDKRNKPSTREADSIGCGHHIEVPARSLGHAAYPAQRRDGSSDRYRKATDGTVVVTRVTSWRRLPACLSNGTGPIAGTLRLLAGPSVLERGCRVWGRGQVLAIWH